MIQVDQYGEFLECSCGNDVMASGFYPVHANGAEVEPIAYSSNTDNFGSSWSIIVECHYMRPEKLGITKQRL